MGACKSILLYDSSCEVKIKFVHCNLPQARFEFRSLGPLYQYFDLVSLRIKDGRINADDLVKDSLNLKNIYCLGKD